MKQMVAVQWLVAVIAGLCNAKSPTTSTSHRVALLSKGKVGANNATDALASSFAKRGFARAQVPKQTCENLTSIAKRVHFMSLLIDDLLYTVQNPSLFSVSDVFGTAEALIASAPPEPVPPPTNATKKKTPTKKEASKKNATKKKSNAINATEAAEMQKDLRKIADGLDGEKTLQTKVVKATDVLSRTGLEKTKLEKLSQDLDAAAKVASADGLSGSELAKNLTSGAKELKSISQIFNISDQLQGGDITTAVKELKQYKKDKKDLTKMAKSLRSVADYLDVVEKLANSTTDAKGNEKGKESLQARKVAKVTNLGKKFDASITSMHEVDSALANASTVFTTSLTGMVNETVDLQEFIGCKLTPEDKTPSKFVMPDVCEALQTRKSEVMRFSSALVPAIQVKLDDAQKSLADAQSPSAKKNCNFDSAAGQVPIKGELLDWCEKVSKVEERIEGSVLAHEEWQMKMGQQLQIVISLMREVGTRTTVFGTETPQSVKDWVKDQFSSISRFLKLLKGVTGERVTNLSIALARMLSLNADLRKVQASRQCRATSFDMTYDSPNCGVLEKAFQKRVDSLKEELEQTKNASGKELARLDSELAKANCADPKLKLPGEGCWFKTPTGCPKLVSSELVDKKDIKSVKVWTKDVFGMRTAYSGYNSEVCRVGRKIQINEQCGVSDTEMYFVPVKPYAPGCYLLTPKGCPKGPDWRKKGLTEVWTVDTYYAAESAKTGESEKGCMDRKAAWDKYCKIKDTKMLFVPKRASMLEVKKAQLKREVNVASASMYNNTANVDFDDAEQAAMKEKVQEMLKVAVEMKERLGSVEKDVSELKGEVGEQKDVPPTATAKVEDKGEQEQSNVDDASAKSQVHIKREVHTKRGVASKEVRDKKEVEEVGTLHMKTGTHLASASRHTSKSMDGLDEAAMKAKAIDMLKETKGMKDKLDSLGQAVTKLKGAATSNTEDQKPAKKPTTQTMDGVSNSLETALTGSSEETEEDNTEPLDSASEKLEESLKKSSD